MPKSTPEWQILAYPRTAIPQRKIEAWAIADIMADLVSGQPSGWGGVLTFGTAANQWSDWARMDNNMQLTNVGFARFLPMGGVEFKPANNGRSMASASKGVAGLFVQPTIRAMTVAAPIGPITSPGTPNANQISWVPQQGDFLHTSMPGTLRPSGVMNAGGLFSPDVANTSTPWMRGAGIHANILTMGANSTSRRGVTILQIGPNLRMVLRQNAAPTLERKAIVGNGSYSATQWDVWRSMDEAGECRLRGENYDTAVYVLGGRLVWQINDYAMWVAEANQPDNLPPGAASPDFVKVADMAALIGGAPLGFMADNVRARIDIGRRQATDESGNVHQGLVSRTITRKTDVGTMLEPAPVGNMPGGTSMDAQISQNGRDVTYTVTLNPSEDGLFAPMLTQFYLAYKPVWTNPVGNAVDISSIVTEASVSHAHPPTQCGTAGSINVDLALMYETMPGVASLLRDYHPVEIKGRWDGEAWQGITKGYFMDTDANQNGYKNSAQLTLSIQGPMARLKAPSSIIDGNIVPADYHYRERLRQLGVQASVDAEGGFSITRDEQGNAIALVPLASRATSFYGAHAAQLIIEQFLGPVAAGDLNGNGDALRYLDNDHPPMLSVNDMTGTWLAVAEVHNDQLTVGSYSKAMKDGFFKPPFGQDALSWINNFAKDEFCIFTEGFANRNTFGWPDLMYGTREGILDSAILHQISGIDVNELLATALNSSTKTEKDINRVLVWCNPFGGEAPPFAPAVVQGEARFRPNHPRSAETTWARTMVLESKLATTPARAKVLAAIVLMEAGGDQFVYPSYTFLGDANCITGDVFTASDTGYLDSEGLWLRAERIEHKFTRNAEGRTWFTTATLRTMSTSEESRFMRNLGLGGG